MISVELYWEGRGGICPQNNRKPKRLNVFYSVYYLSPPPQKKKDPLNGFVSVAQYSKRAKNRSAKAMLQWLHAKQQQH